jgi:hypothetical protein
MPLEELAFAPVPVRGRHDGWSAERQKGFILRLALGGSVAVAAGAVGMTRRSVYRLRDHPGAASFAAAWDKALGWGQNRTIDVGLERAICGERIPVLYRGRRVGERLRFDNRLTFAVLNAIDRRTEARLEGGDVWEDFQAALAGLPQDPETRAPENTGFSSAT